MDKVAITLKIDRLRECSLLARYDGVVVGDVIRAAVEHYLAQRGSDLDAARAAANSHLGGPVSAIVRFTG